MTLAALVVVWGVVSLVLALGLLVVARTIEVLWRGRD